MDNEPFYKERGVIRVYTGPMFAGKSTTILKKVERARKYEMSCLLVKHSFDTRYNEKNVTTHDGKTEPAVVCQSLDEIECLVGDYEVIAIDEAQFFVGLYNFCLRMAAAGKYVYVAGLNTTFDLKPFGEVPALMAIADFVKMLTTKCTECDNRAIFTRRIDTKNHDVVSIGGSEAYVPVCRACHTC